jgi:hypothetical protein
MQFFKKLSAKARLAAVAGTTLMAAGILAVPTWAAPATTTVQLSTRSLAADASGPAVIADKVIPAVSDIKVEACSSRNETWVHITTEVLGKKKTLCYGGKGTMPFSANNTVQVCAGNNYGYLRYSDPIHGAETWQFAPGHVIAWSYGVSVDYLTISSWSGSDRC